MKKRATFFFRRPSVSNSLQNRCGALSIVQISRDKHDYEVKLSNGLELTFDLKFNLIDIDD